MKTEASRGLGYAGVPGGTSSKNGLKGNEGIHLKANRYYAAARLTLDVSALIASFRPSRVSSYMGKRRPMASTVGWRQYSLGVGLSQTLY